MSQKRHVIEYEAVSSLAPGPKGWLYCVGNEDGRVDLCDARTEKQIEFTKFPNLLAVGHLVWSDDGAFLAAADLGGDIVLKRVSIPESGDSVRSIEFRSLQAPKISLEGRAIHQMLFNHDSTLLLVITDDWVQMWDTHNANVILNSTIERGAARRWIRHPIEKSLLLAFGCHDVKLFQWHDFLEKTTLQFREDWPRMHSQASFDVEDEQMSGLKRLSLRSESNHIAGSEVSKALLTQDGKHTLLQVKDTLSQGRSLKRLLIFENSRFQRHDHEPPTLTNLYIPPAVNSEIDIPLGVLSGSRLVFLDPNLWICTYKLDPINHEEVIKRHYFIPRDWASTESLEQCCMMEDGTFLCPKDDTIAVIRHNLGDLSSLRRLY